MPLAVSNIAWSPDEEDSAFDLLVANGISLVEVAPGRMWSDPVSADAGRIPDSMASRGLSICGFQAILFGKADLLLFDPETRPRLLEHLVALAHTCRKAGGRYMVFGAPKNRQVPAFMSQEEAFETATAFFTALGQHVSNLGVTVGIEANPAAYGCNFCTNVAETARLVSAVNSPVIRWHMDTGEFAMNNEPVPSVIEQHAPLIGSVHISEPELGDFSEPWSGHDAVASALKSSGWTGPVSLEMKRPADGLVGVEQAVRVLTAIYT